METETLPQESDFQKLVDDLEELDLSTSELAHRMRIWGDYRNSTSIQRSIQRMRTGEIQISGEMIVIINMLLNRQQQMKSLYSEISWKTDTNGIVSASLGDYNIHLNPYSGGRWVVNVTHIETGYCPPWPVFPKTLERAKRKAIVMIEDTRAYLATTN